ncbi:MULTISPECIES: DUF6115 domain-containing protein [Carboxydocella]|uniref:Uncharacterized protein n=2 Tax=Carboxydocella TaxID=178898 RepID=A0A1T4P839_9FIRM|nr:MULTISPECIES: hypothetical protein [Carboxydocella]AVX20741.1 hypothetical protein CFE_1563 [Carboxydocella thermautotrophica]AVX31160.1 hypothetical protein CTH_1581 [Carboxydocella thermautotrophica]SJZ87750.1 hypothetical protein SAMN02745885_01182 [Carboxydocella sporoproducens DSM 16521]GAW28270.1 putative uncharacterized protein [Carboxydocella sp. ULO1]GAW32159.1 putative uncharacterized protein [Carboxydocella sp. JDF658]
MTLEWWMLLAGILALGWSFWLEKRENLKRQDELLTILTRVEQAKADVALLLTEVEEAAEKLVNRLEKTVVSDGDPQVMKKPKTKDKVKENREKDKEPQKKMDSRFKNKDEIIALWQSGLSIDEIAARLGIGKGEAQLIIDLFGKEAGR